MNENNLDSVNVEKRVNIENTHVPDKVYAYMIQAHHMLYELLNCNKDDYVSMELFEDVGVERADSSKEAIQLKSALSNRNPVSDKAVDLWKTMYNWLISVEEGVLEPEQTKFVLFITVNKDGNIVKSFDLANTIEDAVNAWDTARQVFFDDTGKLMDVGEGYRKYIEEFFAQDKKEIACKIIKNFHLKKCFENYSDTVRKEFDKNCIPEDIKQPVYLSIIGWIDTEITKMVENEMTIRISFNDYNRQLWALYRDYNQEYSLMPIPVCPSEQEIREEYTKQRIYIAQLDIIDCDYGEKVQAINDYLRASINRFKWADKGDVSSQSFDAYEEKLKRSWDLQKRMVLLEKRDASQEDQGKYIYYKCQDKHLDMDTVSVPDFFQSGCYHSLSDRLEIGWHPQYLDKLKRGVESGEFNERNT